MTLAIAAACFIVGLIIGFVMAALLVAASSGPDHDTSIVSGDSTTR
jgi:uncharacterized membrane-anchored protein YhcB (DUF1043 family)